MITTILNAFADREVDLEELNISPRSTQLVSGESRNLNPDVSASKALLFSVLYDPVANPLPLYLLS